MSSEIVCLSTEELGLASGGAAVQDQFVWETYMLGNSTVYRLNMSTSGGGKVNLGPKVDVMPVHRDEPKPKKTTGKR